MKEENFLSVIVPVYNVAPYLRQCLDSIKTQTFGDWEAILVDDGSTDESGRICDEYSKQDERFQTIHKKNGGIVSARKEGLSKARSKYITFIDSDDWIEKDAFKTYSDEIKRTNADILITGLIYEHHKKGPKKVYNFLPEGEYSEDRLNNELIGKMIYSGRYYTPGILPSLWTKVFKRDILSADLEDIDDSLTMGEDVAVTYPCILDAERVVVIKDCFCHYIYRRESMSRKYDRKYGQKASSLYACLEQSFRDKNRDDMEAQLCYHRLYLLEAGIMMILDPRNGLGIKERFKEMKQLSENKALRKGYEGVGRDFFRINGLSGLLHRYLYEGKACRAFSTAIILKIKRSI